MDVIAGIHYATSSMPMPLKVAKSTDITVVYSQP